MKPGFVLDSWAVLAFVQNEAPASHRVRACFDAAIRDEISLAMSIINVGEVLYRISKTRGRPQGEAVISMLEQLALTIVGADDETVMAAARIKADHALSYADAFAAHAARTLDATLLTGDPELLALSPLIRVERLERQA